MNRKQFIVLLVIVAVIGAAGWIVYQRGNSSWQSAGQTIGGKLLPNLQVNDVACISIHFGTNELILEKTNSLWRVRERSDYPADFSRISDTLTKLADLKIVQNEEIWPSQLGRFNLLPSDESTNRGTEVQLKGQGGTTLASLLLGKEHMSQQGGGEGWPDGRYVKTDESQNVAVISDPLDNLQPAPEDWLDKTFFKIENPRSIAVTFPAATNSWKLNRLSATNDWQLAEAKPGEKLDSSKLEGVTSTFDSPSFEDVSTDISVSLDADIVTVETFDGLNYIAKIWPAQDGNYFMTISVEVNGASPRKGLADGQTVADKLAREKQFTHWSYKVPGYTVEPILKKRTQLLLEGTQSSKVSDKK